MLKGVFRVGHLIKLQIQQEIRYIYECYWWHWNVNSSTQYPQDHSLSYI